MTSWIARSVALLAIAVVAAGCSKETTQKSARASTPIPAATLSSMASIGATKTSPVLIRAYKKESEIEVWKQTSSGEYALLKTYPVCRWSGQLGPKKREGDRQVPEGFYTVSAGQMNPNSSMWLSFNVGYPNPLERSLGRNGGDIMVHGTCSSRGCFAMTNGQMEEIYAIAREAFVGGQKSMQFQSYPFRMTAENLSKFRNDPNIAFWKNLKEGSDRFEVSKRAPTVGYCGTRYAFDTDSEPSCSGDEPADAIDTAVIAKQKADEAQVASLMSSGTRAISMRYADGDQHASFRSLHQTPEFKKMDAAGEFSRPEALAQISEVPFETPSTPVTNVAKVETPSTAKPVIVANATKSTPIIPTLSLFSIGSLFKSTTASDTETIDTARAEETPVLDWFKSNDNTSTFPANIPLPPRRG
jgi:murein L,D-transpeptidase YafK